MFQPFERFDPEYINRLISLNKPYLVAQTYTRGYSHFDQDHPVDILLTDYDDQGLAKTHLNALKGDGLACLVNLSEIMLQSNIGLNRQVLFSCSHELDR